MGPSASRQPPTPQRITAQTWLADPALHDVFDCLAAGGIEARVVGGAVRNALMDVPIADIDLATTARPETVIRLAEAAGLEAVPTGIEHGTVTVLARHRAFEVTTLRRDIETDGRRARVTFTTDWSEDARRRDFTMNALYCSVDGTVHDPIGGWTDIAARRVRFIGDAAERIREDFLRILRFFRFTAQYVEGEPDAEGLAACEALQHGIDGLSGERLRAETMKLLVAPRAADVARIMAHSGLLTRVLHAPPDVDALDQISQIECARGRQPAPILRLAALAARSPESAREAAGRLKLSNAETQALARAAVPDRGSDCSASEPEARISIYRHGRDAFEDAVLLAWARSGASATDETWQRRFELGSRFPRPEMPLRGSDVLARGIAPGPEVGRILAAFENWWISQGFPSDPAVNGGALDRILDAMRNDGSDPR